MIINMNVVSGFLGAGKTTFLKKILPYIDGKIAIIENEFGDAGLDGDLINSELPIPVREIYSGCICCSLAKDLKSSIADLILEYQPNQIFIEPSGVASLSDVLKICNQIPLSEKFSIKINHIASIVDASAFEDALESFGTFYLDQIKNAKTLFLSHIQDMPSSKIEAILASLKSYNSNALIFKDDWRESESEEIIELLNLSNTFKFPANSNTTISENFIADTLFSSFSVQKPKIFSESEISKIETALQNDVNGKIWRAKGILKLDTNKLVHFNYTPSSFEYKYTSADISPKIMIIGSKLNQVNISNLFQCSKLQKLI